MKTARILILCLALLPLLSSGCIFVVGGLIADHEMNKSRENSRHVDYDKYRLDAERNNTDREEHNLAPVHIMTFQEWSTGIETNSVQPVNQAK